jgi:hypothetical protein
MRHFDEKPYLRLLEEIGPFKIWLVDGTWVRQHIEREFTNFCQGHHPSFKGKMPPDEFWIDAGANEKEIPFFVDHLLVERYCLEHGKSFKVAEAEGTDVEERERKRADINSSTKSALSASFDADPESLVKAIEIKLLQECEKFGLHIFLVDGQLVRDKIDLRFCAGGHSEVYAYVPDHHVWIDNASMPREWNFYMLHEVHEFRDMENGLKYPDAHRIASRVEWHCRWNPWSVRPVMMNLGLEPLRVKKL